MIVRELDQEAREILQILDLEAALNIHHRDLEVLGHKKEPMSQED